MYIWKFYIVKKIRDWRDKIYNGVKKIGGLGDDIYNGIKKIREWWGNKYNGILVLFVIYLIII